MDLKTEIINNIIALEGGYSNHPDDAGGETNFGITIDVAREAGYKGCMKDFPKEKAFDIYVAVYWNSLRLDDIADMSPLLAREIVDTGINAGILRSAKFLQRSLNVLNGQQKYYPDISTDGIVGLQTLKALKAFLKLRGKEGSKIMLKMLNCIQGEFYISLAEKRETDESFIYGWFKNRIELENE